MKKNFRKLIAVFAATTLLLLPTIGNAATSDNVVFNATVPTMITLAADNHTVEFGTLNIGSVTTPTSGSPVVLTVDANVSYDIKATGAAFSDGATHSFPLSQMQYKIGAGAFADLTTGLRIVNAAAAGAAQTTSLTFQMKAPSAAQFPAAYSTTVTFAAGIVGF